MNQADQAGMFSSAENLTEFRPDLIIWNLRASCPWLFLSVSQISQMYQKCQDIILAFVGLKIVFKSFRVNDNRFAADKLYNVILQAVFVHIYIG